MLLPLDKIFRNLESKAKGPSINNVGRFEGGRGVSEVDMGRYDGGGGKKNPMSAIFNNY